jgi:hypothetical protein
MNSKNRKFHFILLLLNLIILLKCSASREIQDYRSGLLYGRNKFYSNVMNFIQKAQLKIKQNNFNEYDAWMLLFFMNQINRKKKHLQTPPVYWHNRMG